ncbi:signal transducer and activator of transcription 2-like [Pezoporus flaviventris]|uniref:signal transducer and activator of transcription 2-like n=1 Tax=Pezoporus flaviventris TaxID=889875 RepID=UPI002AB041C4|nr:signal transducer and activator of transcription 2-like [Pezoporus flaviventris]
MAQWQEVQNLANAYLEQIHELYAGAALPMAVRQCLAAWIEDQNWRQAAEPLSSHARMLFHSLLVLLWERLGSLGLGNEDFMLRHNLRKAHRDLQAKFEECPETFANLVANLLQEERRILRLGQAGGQGGAAPAPSPSPRNDREQQIQRRLAELHTALQEAECAFRHLEDMQDAFDFCFKVHYVPGEDRTNDPQYAQQIQALQAKLQILDRQRREVLAQIQQLLGRSETLQDFVLQELEAWRDRQQRACMGAPEDTNLRPLETWFTELGQGLFQLLRLLRALGELCLKVTYERDPLKAEPPLLEKRLKELLSYLIQRAFVVEQQPTMPNAFKRPLVLRTATKFSARARLLLRLHDRNHPMETSIHIDRDPPKIKGFRRFNILTSSSKTLLAGDSPQEGLVCDFQYLTLKEQKDSRAGKGSKGGGEGPVVVTEELHLITFTLAYAYCGLELELETSTLPFVIISNNSQLSSAWASILWFNMLSPDPKPQFQFFSAPPAAPWPLLAQVLSWQFQSVAERGLAREHLLMLAEKLFGSKPSPESTLSWTKFSKDGAAGFSFWAWLDGILGLLQEHLKQLWKDGLILGFVSRKQEKKLLKGKRTGTFLIRFSESILGGVTCTWVEHPESGPPAFRAVVPYTAAELVSLALPDIIRDYQLLVEENIPENPLQFLHPNIPRDEAFGPYYSKREEGNLMEQKKYLNRRLIRVSSRQANESWQTEEELVTATENLETLKLQPGSSGAQQPREPGMLQVVPGNRGSVQPTSPGTVQVMATSPALLQPQPPGLEPLQPLQVASGVLEMLQPGIGSMEPQLVLQLIPEGQGMLQPGPGAVAMLQVVPRGQPVPGDAGMLQPVPGDMGIPQPMLGDTGIPQPVPGDAGMLQPVPGDGGMLQPVPGDGGMLQPVPGDAGMLQPVPGDAGMLQPVPGDAGMLQPVPGDAGMLQPVPGDAGMLQPVPGDAGMLQLVSGAVEPLLVPEEPGPLPPELRDLEPLPGSLDMQELLQSLAEGSGTLEALEAAELMPNALEAAEGQGPGPGLEGSAALLDAHDPFLPQPEDAALPAAVGSLFSTDFPPLHIDANDFQ